MNKRMDGVRGFGEGKGRVFAFDTLFSCTYEGEMNSTR